PSLAENDISGASGKDTCPTKFVSCIILLRYLFLNALDSPPPANPPAILLTVILFCSFSSSSFFGDFLGEFGGVRPCRLPWAAFSRNLHKCPLLISCLIKSFNL
ncbi:hypothetical protein A2U01_0064493, partial [Trifolium medium]|nr:hypothetical protein [Trifolium medium]